jgi:hypothetical protein
VQLCVARRPSVPPLPPFEPRAPRRAAAARTARAGARTLPPFRKEEFHDQASP